MCVAACYGVLSVNRLFLGHGFDIRQKERLSDAQNSIPVTADFRFGRPLVDQLPVERFWRSAGIKLHSARRIK